MFRLHAAFDIDFFFSRIKCFFLYIYIFKNTNTIRIIFRTLSIFIPPFFLWIFILIYDYCYPHDIKSDNIIAQNIRIFQKSKKERLNRFNFKKKTPSLSLSFSQTIVRDGDIIAHVSLPTLSPSTSSIIVTKASVQVYNDEGWKRVATWTPSSPRREKLLYATFVSHRTLHVTSVIDRGFKAWPPWCTRFSLSVCVLLYANGVTFSILHYQSNPFPFCDFLSTKRSEFVPFFGARELDNFSNFPFFFENVTCWRNFLILRFHGKNGEQKEGNIATLNGGWIGEKYIYIFSFQGYHPPSVFATQFSGFWPPGVRYSTPSRGWLRRFWLNFLRLMKAPYMSPGEKRTCTSPPPVNPSFDEGNAQFLQSGRYSNVELEKGGGVVSS